VANESLIVYPVAVATSISRCSVDMTLFPSRDMLRRTVISQILPYVANPKIQFFSNYFFSFVLSFSHFLSLFLSPNSFVVCSHRRRFTHIQASRVKSINNSSSSSLSLSPPKDLFCPHPDPAVAITFLSMVCKLLSPPLHRHFSCFLFLRVCLACLQ
jgi:hypothetical protein